jgi:hypothetical protein
VCLELYKQYSDRQSCSRGSLTGVHDMGSELEPILRAHAAIEWRSVAPGGEALASSLDASVLSYLGGIRMLPSSLIVSPLR